MENEEKNKEYQTIKNYINELKKVGFLKVEKNKLSIEEEKFKKKEKILQYLDKEVTEFILKLKEIKDSESRIIERGIKTKENEKFPNKFLFKYISMGRDIKEILEFVLSRGEKEEYYEFISSIYNNKSERIGFVRKIIKTWKIRYKGTGYIDDKCSYIEKINLILSSINISKKKFFILLMKISLII